MLLAAYCLLPTDCQRRDILEKLGYYLTAWWKLSRVPFLSVGILPLILGFVLAWRWGYKGPLGLYLLSSGRRHSHHVDVLLSWRKE